VSIEQTAFERIARIALRGEAMHFAVLRASEPCVLQQRDDRSAPMKALAIACERAAPSS
jgi:hypothetical protein